MTSTFSSCSLFFFFPPLSILSRSSGGHTYLDGSGSRFGKHSDKSSALLPIPVPAFTHSAWIPGAAEDLLPVRAVRRDSGDWIKRECVWVCHSIPSGSCQGLWYNTNDHTHTAVTLFIRDGERLSVAWMIMLGTWWDESGGSLRGFEPSTHKFLGFSSTLTQWDHQSISHTHTHTLGLHCTV